MRSQSPTIARVVCDKHSSIRLLTTPEWMRLNSRLRVDWSVLYIHYVLVLSYCRLHTVYK